MPTTRTELRRSNPLRPQKQRFLILHDHGPIGEYLAWIRRILEHPSADLVAIEPGEPLESAFQRLEAHRLDSDQKKAKYDQAWAVLDSQWHPEKVDALPAPRLIHVVRVAPSFAHWLLSHFEEAPMELSVDEASTRLVSSIAGYDGSLRKRENALYGHFEEARERQASAPPADSTICDLVDAMRASQQRFLGSELPPKL